MSRVGATSGGQVRGATLVVHSEHTPTSRFGLAIPARGPRVDSIASNGLFASTIGASSYSTKWSIAKPATRVIPDVLRLSCSPLQLRSRAPLPRGLVYPNLLA